MKKKLRLLCILMALVLSLGLLSACGGEEPVSLVGNWDCDDYEMSLVFHDDGTADMSDYYDYAVVDYEWDGETLTLSYDGSTLQGVLGEDGSLVVDGDIVFVRVEAITYYPADPGDEGDEPVPYDMTDSAWDVEGVIYEFYADGTLIIAGEYLGSYDWDGYSGTLYVDGSSTSIYYDGEDLYMEGEDGELYLMEYYSIADYDLYDELLGGGDDDDSDDEGGYSLGGAYDNDDEEMSIVFYSDGTVVMSDIEFSDEGTYTVDGDYILMEFEGQIPYEAYYDSSDDSFQVDGLDGWFYYVDEAWYTP